MVKIRIIPPVIKQKYCFFGEIPAKYILNIVDLNFDEIKEHQPKGKVISTICRETGGVSAPDVHALLIKYEYLKKITINNKLSFLPTKKGESIGITSETRKSEKNQTYVVNLYNETAEEVVKKLIQNEGI